jgi:hypothetical protein
VQQPNNAACNDNDPCTADTCAPSSGGTGGDGCVHTPIPNCHPCANNGDCNNVTVCVPCGPTPGTRQTCSTHCGVDGTCVRDTQCNSVCGVCL